MAMKSYRHGIKTFEGYTARRRTIPIWLALLFCVSWICACAALFLIWEKRWTFFTSLYFFFISLSTIGLVSEIQYDFHVQFKEEYHRKLANGMPFDHDEIRKKAMEDQPLLMKLFGPDLMSEEQKEKIEDA
ncbi:hypothetical protein TELCIR_23359, partial [Teladorsagia circumcincta]